MRGHIFLLGFMGCGKSTVGPILATRLSRLFFDIDDIDEQSSRRTIRQIFVSDSEAEFRRLETKTISDCALLAPAVIALGGGAFAFEGNRNTIKEAGLSVWLDCTLDLCLSRVRGDASRPLLGTDDQMREMFKTRAGYYQLADFIVHTREMPPSEVASEILRQIESAFLLLDLLHLAARFNHQGLE